MRQISTDDYILANETQLIYENAVGFEPVRGNLKHWKGYVGTIEGTEIPIFANIFIQDGFPDIAPFVDITPKVNHPNTDDDGTLSIKILAKWNRSYHVHDVINDTKQLFTRVPAKPDKTKRSKKKEKYIGLQRSTIPVRQLPQVEMVATKKETIIETEKREIEDTIIDYQSKIDDIGRKIEKERTSLLKEGGIKVDRSDKEISISLEENLKAESFAIQETLEVLQEKFEDGDMTTVDFLKLYKRYSKNGYKAEKQHNHVKTSGSMSKLDERNLELEANLYASIVTLDNLAISYENNEIDQIAYRKQLRSLIRSIFKSRMQLEKVGFQLENFIKKEKLDNKYPKGIRHLRVAEGVETADAVSIPFDSLKKMPTKTADYVASAIELIDLTRLRSVARADLLLADMDEMLHILKTFPSIPKDHWVIGDINNWRKIIGKYKLEEVIKEEDCEKLEFQAARWLNDFRRVLKEL